MATTVAQLKATLSADTRDFDRAMGRSQTKTQRFGMVAKSALVGGVAGGFYLMAKAAKIGWGEFNRGQAVAAQTNAVIKSTGGVANVTAAHVEALGGKLMRLSGIDDEVVKSGENILLTFRGIRNEFGKNNDIFDQATKATLDLSVAMHKDLNSSAVLVGKALQDPIRGLTALRRVGVQLTVAQEAMIRKMVESGNVMGAQKVILRELRKEFEGSAAAMGQTFGGQLNILRERLNNFLGVMVGEAIPVLQDFATRVLPRINEALVQANALLATFREAWNNTATVLRRHQETINQVTKVLRVLGAVVGLWLRYQVMIFRFLWITVWGKILDVTLSVTDKVIAAIKAMGRAFGAVRGVISVAVSGIVGAFSRVVGVLRTLYGWVTAVISAIRRLTSAIGGIHIPHIDLPNIPGTASGGIVTRPQVRLVGEAGPEAIIPLSKARGMMGGSGGVHVYVSGSVIAERDLANLIRNLEAQRKRRGG